VVESTRARSPVSQQELRIPRGVAAGERTGTRVAGAVEAEYRPRAVAEVLAVSSHSVTATDLCRSRRFPSTVDLPQI